MNAKLLLAFADFALGAVDRILDYIQEAKSIAREDDRAALRERAAELAERANQVNDQLEEMGL